MALLSAEAPQIAKKLFEDRKVLAGGRGRPVYHADFAQIVLVVSMDRLDDIALVKVNRDHLLIEDLFAQEGKFLRLPADVIPDLVIEGTERGWCSQDFRYLVAVLLADLDFRQLLLAWQVAPHGDAGGTRAD